MKHRLAFLFVLIALAALGQKKDAKLKNELEELVNSFHGDVGIYVRHLGSGSKVMINADSIFPTASMIIPITIGIFEKIEKGELDYHKVLTSRDSLFYEGEDILGSFKDGEKISLSKVLMPPWSLFK